MSRSRVTIGDPCAIAACAPMTTYSTACASSTPSSAAGSKSAGNRARAAPELLERSGVSVPLREALCRGQRERGGDESQIVVVLVRVDETERQLETASADEPPQGVEPGLDLPALVPADQRAGGSRPCGQLRLGEARAPTGFDEKIGAQHRPSLTHICAPPVRACLTVDVGGNEVKLEANAMAGGKGLAEVFEQAKACA